MKKKQLLAFVLGSTLPKDVDQLTTIEEEEFEAGFFCHKATSMEMEIRRSKFTSEHKRAEEYKASFLLIDEDLKKKQKEAKDMCIAMAMQKSTEVLKVSDDSGKFAMKKYEEVMAHAIIMVHDYVKRGVHSFDFSGTQDESV
ncbi:hypothetical protein NE237_019448 [Protea cynaroides]|uniref:Uncharacterized protein n=1 Tax=Protea cynaroides TaxID=273540 RepID=A0A9Q0KBX3_9MAGN|nr:hypothetical protein NE237_019448 [Protea cynaroides]